MTNKPPLSPSLSMKPSVGPKKPQPQPTQPMRVEAEKLDPSVFFGKKKSPEQELLENAEPIVPQTPAAPAPMPIEQEDTTAYEQDATDSKDKKSFIDNAVSDSLIDKLVEEYGFEPSELRESSLQAPGGKPLKISFRAVNWDDYAWALSAVQVKEKEEEKNGNFFSEAQRAQIYQALTACRCIVKISDVWVWDLFDVRQEIKKVKPSWDGVSHSAVPSFIANVVTLRVFDLFSKKLHPDLLFSLSDVVMSWSFDKEDQKDNPTEAT
jgi:hypothetical protein